MNPVSGTFAFWSASNNLAKEIDRAAAGDGANHFPGQHDSSLSQFEQSLVHRCSQAVKKFSSRLLRTDAPLRREFDVAKRDHLEAKERYDAKKKEVGDEPVRIEISTVKYWLFTIALFVGEVPINFTVFNAMFGQEGTIFALSASVVLAFALLLGAHFVGKSFRQKRHRLYALFGIAIIAAVIAGLAYVRVVHFSYPEEADILSRAFGHVDPVRLTGFFVAINVLFFFLGVWIGILRHDPDVTYHARYVAYVRARRIVSKLASRRDENLARHCDAGDDLIGMYRRSLTRYRQVNMDHREIKATPRAWIDNPPEQLLCIDNVDFRVSDNDPRI